MSLIDTLTLLYDNMTSTKEIREMLEIMLIPVFVQCNLSIPNLVYSEILFNPNKLFGPKVF